MARPKGDIEPRILHAARACFLENGVDATSLRRIARVAHTNIGMIYYYFPTKDDLFLAVVEEFYEALLGEISALLSKDVAFEKRIHALSARFGALSKTEREVVYLVAREALTSSARRDRLLERFTRGHIALMIQTVLTAVAQDELDKRFHPGILSISTFVLCVAPQLIRHIAADRMPWSQFPEGDEFATQLVQILLGGARTRKTNLS